jgi:hypothetical protein
MAYEVVLHGLGCGLVWGFWVGVSARNGVAGSRVRVEGHPKQYCMGLGWNGTRSSIAWG